jgi:hypothetical protein
MEQLSWLGFAAFLAVGLGVGVRLLALARRTGELPELLIGIGVLGIGSLGFGLSMLAGATAGSATVLSLSLRAASYLAVFVGATSHYLFAWYVFRLRSRWAKALTFSAIAALGACYVADVLDEGLTHPPHAGAGYWFGISLRFIALVWSCVESLHAHRLLRRRQRLGLADAAVTRRFGFLGVGTGAVIAAMLFAVAVRLLTGRTASSEPAAVLVLSALGTLSALALWRAFRPPARRPRRSERGGARDALPSPRP